MRVLNQSLANTSCSTYCSNFLCNLVPVLELFVSWSFVPIATSFHSFFRLWCRSFKYTPFFLSWPQNCENSVRNQFKKGGVSSHFFPCAWLQQFRTGFIRYHLSNNLYLNVMIIMINLLQAFRSLSIQFTNNSLSYLYRRVLVDMNQQKRHKNFQTSAPYFAFYNNLVKILCWNWVHMNTMYFSVGGIARICFDVNSPLSHAERVSNLGKLMQISIVIKNCHFCFLGIGIWKVI